jgi:proteasome accessory factor A
MGLETEFGITTPGDAEVNPMVASSAVVTAYAKHIYGDARLRWDYDVETPMRDARASNIKNPEGDLDVDLFEDPGMANVVLTNGARFYVDHAHPEYSSPETTSPLDAVLWDRAGEVVVSEGSRIAMQITGIPRIGIYKNNTDNKGASYGCHENYLLSRKVAFDDIVAVMTPFFVSRQIYCGAGRVGLEQDSSSTGFQISQRADFFEAEVGLETTLKRPIINTRDEPHADPEAYRRFHVIVGDANMCDFANYLKVGVTALVIFALESGWLEANSLKLESPLLSLREVSRDLDLDVKLSLARGGKTTALEIQRQFFSQIEAALNEDVHAQLPWVSALMSAWQQTLESLERDPMSLVGNLDWVTKKWIIDGYRKRDNLDWSDPRLVAVDLQWSDLSPEKGLAMVLRRRGTIKSLVSNEQASWAAVNPPPQTRAWFRGEVLRRFANCVAAASWDSLIVDVPGRESLVRVPTLDPFKGTKEHVGHLMSKCEDIGQLLVNLDG